MGGAVRRADERHFVEIVLHAFLAQHCATDNAAAHIANGQAVGTGGIENVIGGFAPAATVHVLMNDGGISRDVLVEKRPHRAHTEISPIPPRRGHER
jgi:hypothetical protein